MACRAQAERPIRGADGVRRTAISSEKSRHAATWGGEAHGNGTACANNAVDAYGYLSPRSNGSVEAFGALSDESVVRVSAQSHASQLTVCSEWRK